MITVDRMEALCRDVVLGTPKQDSVQNHQESAGWDRVVVEVAEIRAKGGMVDLPWDPA